MLSRSLARLAVRQPLRQVDRGIGMAIARRGLSTSGARMTVKPSWSWTMAALVSGGALLSFSGMQSGKIQLEAASKSKPKSEKEKKTKKDATQEESGQAQKKDEVTEKDEKKEESASDDSKKKEEVEEASPIDMDNLSEDASQQSAFDPETNTINWDCPCLGGMAHGPCGEQFKEAFSCFVFSEEEVKGVDCIDKFKAMQDCFRKYPEHYKEELEDEEEFERSEAERETGQTKANEGEKSSSPEDDDEGLREWRAELAKEK